MKDDVITLENLQQFKENLDNTYATKEDVAAIAAMGGG